MNARPNALSERPKPELLRYVFSNRGLATDNADFTGHAECIKKNRALSW